MLCGVDADVQQRVFRRDSGNGAELEFNRLRAPPEGFLGRGKAERARRDLPMSVHGAHPASRKEGVLTLLKVAGRQSLAPDMWRQIPLGGEYFGDPRQIRLVHQDIQIDELAQVGRSVRHRGQHWTLEGDRLDSRLLHQTHQAHELGDQMAVVKRDQLPLRSHLCHRLRRRYGGAFETQVSVHQRENRMAFGDIDDAVPTAHARRESGRPSRARCCRYSRRAAQHQSRFGRQVGMFEESVGSH